MANSRALYSLLLVILSCNGIHGLSCFACTNIAFPRDCPYVTKCGPHEECYVDQFVTPDGHIFYTSGCRDTLRCTTKRNTRQVFPGGEIKTCTHCCKSDHCNYGGCGEPGLPGRNLRGPICYNCFEQRTENGCNRVKVCGRDEQCEIMGSPDAIYSVAYRTGCLKKETCNIFLSPALGKRQISSKRSGKLCLNCCDNDLCNNNCTTPVRPAATGASATQSSASQQPSPAATQPPPVTAQPTTVQPTTIQATTIQVTTIQATTTPSTTTTTTTIPTTPTTQASKNCAAGLVKYQNSCYFFSTEIKYWDEAEQICQVKGGYLVKIEDIQEQLFIASQISPLVMSNKIPSDVWGYYFGAHLDQGKWKWADGTPLSYNNWGLNEPDNPHEQIYGLIFLPGHYVGDYKWGSHKNMLGTSRYICEIPLP